MTNLFYRNRRLLVLTISLVLVSGLSSFYVLPRMEDPLLTPRFALVNTRFPGADAERVESLVTEKLEEELREIEEIKELRSTSRVGVSTITIELRDDIYKTAEIWSRIRDKLDDAALQMPPDAMKPDFDELDVKAYALIVALRWSRDGDANYAILRRLAEQLDDEIKAVPGTEQVDTYGDPEEEILVTIRQAELASLGISASDVARQLGASDAKVAAGQLRGQRGDLLFEVDAELDSLAHRPNADSPWSRWADSPSQRRCVDRKRNLRSAAGVWRWSVASQRWRSVCWCDPIPDSIIGITPPRTSCPILNVGCLKVSACTSCSIRTATCRQGFPDCW